MIDTTLSLLYRVTDIVADIHYRPEYWYRVELDEHGRVYVQLEHNRLDARTAKWGRGTSSRYYVSDEARTSQIVRACLGLAIGYEEHEVREFFRYRGAQVFGPHIDVDALVEVAERLDI